ncbi:phosphotransferase [Actinomycetospora termitidis]|uniref:Phosphotransferase n=1 Tax=Actinomycetospora termitidis TaxID=3053470 RepID=A0ABT7MHP7_9PSEU|nr:phosphotransferase [Actinomycetospora sp. Odt1-22]MDL5160203.1 phosphotransferase [Actinomycetospora sp. Odt1-22]
MTTRQYLGSGWDSDAWLVDGTWVERTARRPDVEPWLRTETTLLPWLAPQLPLEVPAPVVVKEEPLTVRHRLVPGRPAVPDDGVGLGAAVGGFLAALHAVDLAAAVARGLPPSERTSAMRDAAFDRFADQVVPRLPSGRRAWLTDRLELLRDAPASHVVHGDLSAEHVLVADGRVTGVIDWGDARAGDPAKDLVWPLYRAGPRVADAVRATYDVTPDLARRARAWLDVGPCYAVTHGLDTGDDALVRAALSWFPAA